MNQREYFSIRKGYIKKDNHLTFENLKKAFLLSYSELDKKGYFQKYYGKDCVDGDIKGELGNDIAKAIYLKTGIETLYPFYARINYMNESEFYTMIEILHDTCSKPIKVYLHSFADCGIHVLSSDNQEGREYFRNAINPLLKRYKNIELSEQGEILESIEE